ncbi:MAG: hypothetical protein MJ052_02915 [Sphaerochaetaceae bacterium]|nr:hypothetical protein [Sphaerochaetaceae bacterium]
MDKKRCVVIAFVLILLCPPVFSKITIVDYKLNLGGKMKPSFAMGYIRGSNESFDSEEALMNALANKRQNMINSRYFLEETITYSYELTDKGDGNFDAVVTFNAESAKTFLILPYPHYSSGDGLTLSMRFYDRNMFGRMADFQGKIIAYQHENTFAKGSFAVDLPLSNLRLDNGMVIDAQLLADYDIEKTEGNFIYAYAEERGFKLGNVSLGFGAGYGFNFSEKKTQEFRFKFTENGINIGNRVPITASADIYVDKIDYERHVWSDSYMVYNLGISNIPLGKVPFSNTLYLDYDPRDNSVKTWKMYRLMDTLSFNFNELLKGFSVSSQINYYEDYYSNKYDYAPVYTTFNYRISKLLTAGLAVDHFSTTKPETAEDGGGFYRVDIGPKVGFNFNIGKLPFYASVKFLNSIWTHDGKYEPRIDAAISASKSTTFDYAGNFRHGYSFNISFEFGNSLTKSLSYIEHDVRTNFTGFWDVGGVFNPNVRFILRTSEQPEKWFNNSDYYTIDDLDDMMRGVYDDDSLKEYANLRSNIGGLLNVNLPIKFLTFEDFGKTYLNFFSDFVFWTKYKNYRDQSDPYFKFIWTAGLELLAVIDEYPSFPLRVSFGLDLRTFHQRIIKKDLDTNLGYELFVGLGWFF